METSLAPDESGAKRDYTRTLRALSTQTLVSLLRRQIRTWQGALQVVDRQALLMHQVAHLGQFVSERLNFADYIALRLVLRPVENFGHPSLVVSQDGDDRNQKDYERYKNADVLRRWHIPIMTSTKGYGLS